MENITEANISTELTKHPQQDRLYQLNTFRVKRNNVIISLPGYFSIENSLFKNSLDITFVSVNRFSNFLLHISRQI